MSFGNIALNLNGVTDPATLENFQKLQNAQNGNQFTQNQLQACEIYVTANQTGIKLNHQLGGIPLDVILTRLIAPSAARLVVKYSEFTKDAVVFDVSGLAAGETLSARFVIGVFPDLVTSGTVARGDAETQQLRSKF